MSSLLEKIRAAQKPVLKKAASPKKTVLEWAAEWNMGKSLAEKTLRSGCAAGLMKSGIEERSDVLGRRYRVSVYWDAKD